MKNEEVKDIVPELFDKIDKTFKLKAKESKIIKDKLKVLKNNKANYKDANEFSVEVGKILADTFQDKIKTGDLPDGKMYYNIAKRLIEPNMVRNHDLVSEYSKEVQSQLNKQANISIQAQKADLNQDRIDKLVDKITKYDSFDDGKWLLNEPIVNFTLAVVDETIRKNADLHAKAGLSPKIERYTNGKCCDWCDKLAGIYNYEDVKNTGNEVFRRHRHCDCLVIYDPKNGSKRTNIHTHKPVDDSAEKEKIKKRIELSEKEKESNKLVRSCLKEKIEYNPVELSESKRSGNEIIKDLAGGDNTKGSCSSLAFAYIGNKAGYDVLDFRGGKSCDFFANYKNIEKISKLNGVNSYIERDTNDFKAVKKLISHVEPNKEYYLATGGHAAIIRKSEKRYEYLELQSPETEGCAPNGFSVLNDRKLKERFGCKKSHTVKFIGKIESPSVLIDAESLYDIDEFKSLLGFINTNKNSQVKGSDGRVR